LVSVLLREGCDGERLSSGEEICEHCRQILVVSDVVPDG
jgi:hypothetical protein